MHHTVDQSGEVLAETEAGVTLPGSYGFETIGYFVGRSETTYEELQALCLAMAEHIEKLPGNKMININDLTIRQIRDIQKMALLPDEGWHPMMHIRCVVSTKSAGTHIGLITWINPRTTSEVKLEDSLLLCEDDLQKSGLSLATIAHSGLKKGRLSRTGEIFLTDAISFIPTTLQADITFLKFIED